MRLKKSFTAHMSIILSLAMVFTTPMQAVPVMAAPIVENDILEQEPDIIMDDIETGKDDGVLYEDTKDGINKEEELLGAEDVLETASAGGDEIGTADDSADLLDSSDDDLVIGNEGENATKYPVVFHDYDGNSFKTVQVNMGTVIAQEQIPDDENYSEKLSIEGCAFEGWSVKTEEVGENDLFDTKNTLINQAYDLYPVYSSKVNASFAYTQFDAIYGDIVSENDNKLEITPIKNITKYIHGDYTPIFSSGDEDVAVGLLDYGVLAVSTNGDYETTITASVNSVFGTYLGKATYDLKVNKKDLTVSAGNAVKVYDGTPLSKNRYTSDGLAVAKLEGVTILEDVIDDITVTGSRTDVGVSDNTANVTKIVRNDANRTDVTENYNISYINGKLEVTPRDLTLEWSGKDSYKFDYKVHKPTVSAGNIVDGDTVSVNVKVYKADDAEQLHEETDPTDVGSYVAVATLDKDKFDNNNYALSSNTIFEYEITEDAIEREVISYNGVYDQKKHGITVSVNHPETGYEILYKTGEEEDYHADKPEFKNVGDYTVYYKVTAPNFEPVSGNSTVTIIKADMPVSANDVSVSFDGVPHSISIDGIPEGEGAVVKYGTEEGKCDKSSYNQTGVGSWTVYFKVTAPNYNDYTGSAKLTITGVPAKVIIPPTSVNGIISYNKAEQELFKAGTTDTKLWYSLDYNGDKDKATWYPAPPKGKDAGTYNLYYYADSDTNHSASTVSGPVEKEIEKAVPAVIAPVSANSLSYNEADQVLVTAGTTDDECTLMYAAVKWDGTEPPEVLSKNDARWSDKLPKGKDAGTYRVFWYVKGNANYKDVDPSAANKVDTVINKADPKLNPAPVSANNLTYNGLSQNLLKDAGKTDGGTLMYKMGGGNYSTTVPFATKAGKYTVTYKVFGNKNYNDSAEASLNIWIAKKPVTLSVNTATYIYHNTICATETKFTISVDGFVDVDGPVVYENGTPGMEYYDSEGNPKTQGDINITQYVPFRHVTIKLGENTQISVLVRTCEKLPWLDYYDAKTYSNLLAASIEGGASTIDPSHKLDNYSLPADGEDFFGDLVVNKANILPSYIDPEPKANEGLSYNGHPHTLVSAGQIDNRYGQLMYSADYTPATGYKPASGEDTFSFDLPEKTNAGEYNVYYKVKGSKNYNDSTIFGPVEVKISTADSEITHPAKANVGLYFNNKEQYLLSEYAEANNGTILYYVDSTGKGAPAKDSPAWTQTEPKAINAGKYTVYYYCKGDPNYSDVPKSDDEDYPYRSVTTYIQKAQLKITANDATVVYGDPWDDEFTASIEAVHGVYNPADFELLGIKYDKATGNAVGTYKVMPRMVYNPVNYEVYGEEYGDEGYVYGTLTITPAPLTVKADDQYKNYGDKDPELTYTVTGLKYNDTKDVLTNVSIKRAKGEDAGKYPITISGDKIAGNENYNPVTYEDGTFVIGRSDVLVTVLPEAKDLTYNRTEQELVKAGSAFGVDNEPLDFMYSEDYAYDPTTNTVTNSGNWVPKIPTKMNVGTYPVWWKVVSGNYIETDPAPLSVTIKARPFRLDPEVAVSQNVYDGTPKALTNESVLKGIVSGDDIKLEYRVGGDGEWSTVIPRETDAGEYDIYYRVNVDDNHKVVDKNYEVVEITEPLKAKIAKRPFTIDPEVAVSQNLVYDGTLKALTNESVLKGIVSGDDIQLEYRVGLDGEWSTAYPKATEVGEYLIYYRVVNKDGDINPNYVEKEITGPLKAEICINQSELETAPKAESGLVYNAESRDLVSKGTAKNGTVKYADLNHALAEGETITNWSDEVPKATNAGTHYIYYMVEGKHGYADVAQAGPLTVTIAKAAAPTINKAPATLLRSEGTDDLSTRITWAEGTKEAWYSSPKYSLTGSDSVASLSNNIVRAKSQTGIVTAKIEILENDNTLGASAEIKITVKGQNEGGESGDKPEEDGELKAWLADVDTLPWNNGDGNDKCYALTYTGEPIKPEVIVTNGSKVLVPGTDYSVAYQNNKEANVTYNDDNELVAIAKKKLAKVIITGKGNYSTKKEIEFLIVAKNIADDDVYVGNTVCEFNKKPAPVVTYMGKVVNKKNYTGVPANNLPEDTAATIYGTGNFYGERSVDFTVKVKSALKEFKVRLANVDNIYYNGDAKKLDPESQLIVSDKSTGLPIDPENYIVSYGDNVNAGTVNVYVIGTGLYKGSVKKTFKIRPAKFATFTITNAAELATTGYPYSSLGVTPEPYLSAKIDKEHDEVSLVLGRDYTVTYKDNKKVGSGMVDIKFKGNYQGAPKLSQSFKIKLAEMTEENCEIRLAKSLVYNSKKPKASNYFVKKNKNIFVELNGVMLKSGDYEVSFWHDVEGHDEELTKESEIKAGETITVKIKANTKTGKYVTAEGADIKADYVVTEVPSGGIDISKAKVSVVNGLGRKKSVGYTGKAITFPIKYPENIQVEKLDKADLRYLQVVVKEGNKNVTYSDNPESDHQISGNFEVSYVNNVRKGTATVIITPKEGTDFYGSAVGTFKIDSSIFKTFLEFFLDEQN